MYCWSNPLNSTILVTLYIQFCIPPMTVIADRRILTWGREESIWWVSLVVTDLTLTSKPLKQYSFPCLLPGTILPFKMFVHTWSTKGFLHLAISGSDSTCLTWYGYIYVHCSNYHCLPGLHNWSNYYCYYSCWKRRYLFSLYTMYTCRYFHCSTQLLYGLFI